MNLGCFPLSPAPPPADFLQGGVFSIEHALILSQSKSKALCGGDRGVTTSAGCGRVSDACPPRSGGPVGALLRIESQTRPPRAWLQAGGGPARCQSGGRSAGRAPRQSATLSRHPLPGGTLRAAPHVVTEDSHGLSPVSFPFKREKCHTSTVIE